MTTASSRHELVLNRIINAPRHNVYRCWTEAELLKQWFAPKPWTTPHAEMDVRPGGSSMIVMRSPEGQDMPNPGMYLEVIPNEKLVITDAYTGDWEPSEKPFMTVILTFEDAGNGKTNYTVLVRHWTEDDRKKHEEMGFHTGWGQCTDQLEEAAKGLAHEKERNPVVHFEMPYADEANVTAFYESVFGWKTQKLGAEMGHYILATTTEIGSRGPLKPCTINGGFYLKKENCPQHPSVVIAVSDIQESIQKIEQAGGKTNCTPMEIPGVGHYASITDPEGNTLAILQPFPSSWQEKK